tara:strand:+ start:240 stop:860 length:621 start_codon:yes stop_codon:yes gene_type:complete
MATIPTGQQFHTLSADVDTVNRGSATANSDRTIFTMADIISSVPGGGPTGTGTAGAIVKWSDTEVLADSLIKETASDITIPRYVVHEGDSDTSFGFSSANTYQVLVGNNFAFAATSAGSSMYGAGGLQVNVSSTGTEIKKLNVSSTDVPTGLVNAPLHVAFGVAPTAASYGKVGDIIITGAAIYVCTVAGSDPTAATWLKADLVAL